MTHNKRINKNTSNITVCETLGANVYSEARPNGRMLQFTTITINRCAYGVGIAQCAVKQNIS